MARVAAIGLGDVIDDPGPPAAGGGTAVRVPAALLAELADIVDFVAAGAEASGEFRCADCGYGAVVQHILPACPMCHSTVWERRERLASRFAD